MRNDIRLINFHGFTTSGIFLGLLLLFGFGSSRLKAQITADSSAHETSYFALPLVFSNPESGVGFGAGFLTRFTLASDSLTRESNVQLGGAYTTKEQILSYAFYQIFTPQSKQYFFGELGYYDFNYLFYGLGNTTRLGNEEAFFFDLYRVRFTGLQQLAPQHYVGLRWFYDYWNIKSLDRGQFLDTQKPLGIRGGASSALGATYLLDSRNDVFYPNKGQYLELALLGQENYTGGDFSYLRFTTNYSNYLTLTQHTTLAVNLKLDWLWGRTAFFDLPQLGGLNNLRGFYLGRFRDTFSQLVQTELRQHLYWRFRLAAFAGIGQVSPSLNEALQNRLHLAGGLGLRYKLLKNSQANLRVDFAWGDGPLQIYVGLGEAF